MNEKLYPILLRIHFSSLALAILNSIVKNISTYSLEIDVEFGLEMICAFSGLLLFFWFLRRDKSLNFYFSLYAITSVLLLIGLAIRGLFFAMILSIILFPIIPDSKEFEENGIIISTPFEGLLAACCNYEIKERHLFIFTENHGKLEMEEMGPIDFERVQIQSNEKEIEIYYSTQFEEDSIETFKVIKHKLQD